jgi:hypothetical protein
VQENQEGLELKRTRQLQVYPDDVYSSGKNINCVKNLRTILDATKGSGLEVHAENSKHIFVSRYQMLIKTIYKQINYTSAV